MQLTSLVLCLCVGQAIVIAASVKFLAITIPFVVAVVWTIQRLYLQTSRQLRILDIEVKSSLYSNFLETVQGIVTIRAFRSQSHWTIKSKQHLDNSQQPIYLLYTVQRWLSLVLELVTAALVTILLVIAIEVRSSITASAIGVALVSVVNFNQSLINVVRFWAAMETSLGAIARVKAFAKETPSEKRQLEHIPTTSGSEWPVNGIIVMQEVCISYEYVMFLTCVV
jgi:ATP-binding cassette, subfamily C (CFTR/MRP), member 1